MMEAKNERYHPNLLTPEEVQDDPTIMYSDHLPTLYTIPVGREHLKILSWNLYKTGLPCGYEPFFEEEHHRHARAIRLQKKILDFHHMHTPEIITFQECMFNEKELAHLVKLLGDDWVIAEGSDVREGLITLYNKKQVQQNLNLGITPEHIHRMSFNVAGKDVLLGNVRLPNQDLPEKTENAILSHLMMADNSVIVGDFNSRIAPTTYEPENIVTALAPQTYRDGYQGCDFTDGAFYKNGFDTPLCQAQRNVLDISTGSVLHLPSIDVSDLPIKKRQEVQNYRVVVNIDPSFAEIQLGKKYKNVDELAAQFPGLDLTVQFAANANNSRAVGLIFKDSQISEEIRTELVDKAREIGVQFRWSDTESGKALIAYVPYEKVDEFVEVYKSIMRFKRTPQYEATHTTPAQRVAEQMSAMNTPDEGILEHFNTNEDLEKLYNSSISLSMKIAIFRGYRGDRTDFMYQYNYAKLLSDDFRNQNSVEEAAQIFRNIKAAEDPPEKEAKATLQYVRGLLFSENFRGTKENFKQALIYFNQAADMGYTKAFEKLASLYYRAADTDTNREGPIYDNFYFQQAMVNYLKAVEIDVNVNSRLAIRIYNRMGDEHLLRGHYDEAVFYKRKAIESLRKIDKNNLEYFRIQSNIQQLESDIKNIESLSKNLVVLEECEATNIRGEPPPYEETVGEHPILDYYYLCHLLNTPINERDNVSIQKLLTHLSVNTYPPEMHALANYAKAMLYHINPHNIMNDNMALFSDLKESSWKNDRIMIATNLYKLAARSGVIVAFEKLSQIYFESDKLKDSRVNAYFGFQAGDVKSTWFYYTYFLKPEIHEATHRGDNKFARKLITEAEKCMQVLTQMHQDNEFTLTCNAYEIPWIKKQFNLAGDKPLLFEEDELIDFKNTFAQKLTAESDKVDLINNIGSTVKEMIDAIITFRESKESTENRLKILSQILEYAQSIQNQCQNTKVDCTSVEKIIRVTQNVRHFLMEQQARLHLSNWQSSMEDIRKLKGKERLKGYVKAIMGTGGHVFLKGRHVIERADPLHRPWLNPKYEDLVVLFQEWQNDPTIKKSFLTWLDEDKNAFFSESHKQVFYFDSEERQHFSAKILHGKLTTGSDQNVAEIPDGDYIFAIGLNNRVYIAKEGEQQLFGRQGFVQHSSLVNGENIICAGDIRIQDGKIIYMNNGSGHYEPTVSSLEKAVKILSEACHKDIRVRAVGILNFPEPLPLNEFENVAETMKQFEAQQRYPKSDVGTTL